MEKSVGIIGGSGLGDAFKQHLEDTKQIEVKTPFGAPSDKILTGTLAGRQIAFINRHGAGHRFSPSAVPYAANIFALKQLGVISVIASGAVGSLDENIRPKDIVIVNQVIDKTFKRTKSFFDGFAAVHCEMAQPYCTRLSDMLVKAGEKVNTKVHSGATYVCMEGPQFSTKAESLMHRQWGGQLIGMTGMPEAKLAREAQMCFALVGLISDYDCWKKTEEKKDAQTLLAEIIGNLNEATDNAIELIKAAVSSDMTLCNENCPCRKSLKLAVWTKPEHIDQQGKKILDVLKQ